MKTPSKTLHRLLLLITILGLATPSFAGKGSGSSGAKSSAGVSSTSARTSTSTTSTRPTTGSSTRPSTGTSSRPASNAPKVESASAPKTRGGYTPSIARGQKMHEQFKTQMSAREGTKVNTRMYSLQQNPRIKGLEKLHGVSVPDAMSRSGRPMELKPDSPSGRRAMESQMGRYEYLSNRRGIRAYYDPAGNIRYQRTPWSEYRARPEVRSLRRLP